MIDVFRGLACLAVVIVHSSLLLTVGYWDKTKGVLDWIITRTLGMSGECGVVLFFVISGYGLAGACERAVNSGWIVKYPFLRYKRILPMYWAGLGVVVLLKISFLHIGAKELLMTGRGLEPMITSVPLSGWLSNIFLQETWMQCAGVHGAYHILGVAWFLCFDLQFCFFIAFVFLVFRRASYRAVLAMVVALGGMLVLGRWHLAELAQGTLLDGRFIVYACGVLAYWGMGFSPMRKGALGAFLIAIALLFFMQSGRVAAEIWMGSLFSLALLLLRPFDVEIGKWKLWEPLRFVGSRSFSIYLIHTPLVIGIGNALGLVGIKGPLWTIAVVVPVCVAASLAVAELFYRKVEYPLIRS